jgi:AcrR family transcriptional regulator
MAGQGLRERKKLATRQALSWAAIRLAVQRGFDNVLVEDIAAAAGVSPRTYNNYFASKEEAICAVSVDRAELIGVTLLQRPADEPLADAVLAAMMTYYQPPGGDLDRDWVNATRLMMTSPALRGEMLKAGSATEARLAEAIAQRCGLPADDLYAHVLGAMLAGAARMGIQHWLGSGTTEPFTDVLTRALRQALAGVGTPPGA